MTTYSLAHLQEASKMFLRAYAPYTRYTGSTQEISRKIIKNCWNGKYFQVSTGHFNSFYCRDFGMCAQSLMNLGYENEVLQTLLWALDIFARNNRITTTITKKEVPIDCFMFGCDSLPFLLHAVHVCNNTELIEKYRPFLEKQAIVYIETVFDKKTNLVKEQGKFSSMKDHYVRKSSCYDNCMVGWLLQTMKQLKYDVPIHVDMRSQLLKHYWTGSHFKDDFYTDLASADAQFFPFYTGLLDAKKKDKKIWKLAVSELQAEGLDKPFPVRYTKTRDKSKELFFPSLLAPNYEGTAVWMHLGLCYIKTVYAAGDVTLAKEYVNQYTQLIEKHKNFLEVFTSEGKIYRSLFYQSDESMIWVSIYLDMYLTVFDKKKSKKHIHFL